MDARTVHVYETKSLEDLVVKSLNKLEKEYVEIELIKWLIVAPSHDGRNDGECRGLFPH